MPVDADAVPVHPDASALGFLLGTWIGHGHGRYPTIGSFDYREEVRFWHLGQPFLAYRQRTWAADDGRPLHAELGFWRPKPGRVVEVVLSHPTGHVEIEEGGFAGNPTDGHVVEVSSRLVEGATSAKQVSGLARRLVVRGDELSYTLAMAAVGLTLQPHLSAQLHRTD